MSGEILRRDVSRDSIARVHKWTVMQGKCSEEPERWADAQRDGRPAEYRWRALWTSQSFANPHCSSAVQ